MKKVIIEIEVDTVQNDLDISKAIEKGIYWGLDIKRIAMPKNVTIKNVSIKTI